MASSVSVQHVVDELAREPVRNIVRLKHLQAFPAHSKVQQGVHRLARSVGLTPFLTIVHYSHEC